MRNGSGGRDRVLEMPTAIGAMMKAVAALLMISERHMVTIMTRLIMAQSTKAQDCLLPMIPVHTTARFTKIANSLIGETIE